MFFLLLAAGAALLFMNSSSGGGGPSGPRADLAEAWKILAGMNVVLQGGSKFDGPGGAPFVIIPLQPKQSGVSGVDASRFLAESRKGDTKKTFWVDPDWRAVVVSASNASPGGSYKLLLAPGDVWPPAGG
jgi:hypothetical protein